MSYPAPHYVSESDSIFFGNGLYKKTAYGPADGHDISTLPEGKRRQVVEGRIRDLARTGGWSEDKTEDTSLPEWQRRGFSWEWRDDGVDIFQRVPGECPSDLTKGLLPTDLEKGFASIQLAIQRRCLQWVAKCLIVISWH